MLSTHTVRPMGTGQIDAIGRVLHADPYANVTVACRFDEPSTTPAAFAKQFWGISGGRQGLCYIGGNLIPVSGDERAMHAFAGTAARWPRFCASVMGRAELVHPLWEMLTHQWGPARVIRAAQPFLVCRQPPLVEPDPLVRYTHPEDLPVYFPAAVAMFTEEMGADPRAADGGTSYRNRLLDLVAAGRSFIRVDGGEVVFKAEVGAVSRSAAMIQGVWVHPDLRGQGLGAAGMAAVVRAIQEGMARTPVLYVNDFNHAARSVYQRIGFQQVATFASVLF